MARSIPAKLVDFILLGPFDDRRQLQDSPILGDVWVEFGARPADRLELLITPYRGQPAGAVAELINDKLGKKERRAAQISCVHGFIAANLSFQEVLRYVVPHTQWWAKKLSGAANAASPPPVSVMESLKRFDLAKELGKIFEDAEVWHSKQANVTMREVAAVPRFVALTGLLLWAAKQTKSRAKDEKAELAALLKDPKKLAKSVQAEAEAEIEKIAKEFPLVNPVDEEQHKVYSVSHNRKAMPALEKSVAAVKADAARSLFTVSCRDIGWGVLDSGIDAGHPAFYDAKDGKSRVRGTFNFSQYRKLVNLANRDDEQCEESAREIVGSRLKSGFDQNQVKAVLKELADNVREGRPVRWDLVEHLVEIEPGTEPVSSHGTHVAGILGASSKGAERYAEDKAKENLPAPNLTGFVDGMCPDIKLYDFRVLGRTFEETEFAIIAALQFIRYLNQRDTFMTIHGVNMSLSIPHKVRNYACGQTPICEECNRLSENGVVVVAAAGNHGHKTFTTSDGEFEAYAAFSITDPGNADDVITVGATHRYWPHTYGVSFFSSRGPTGDGRLKPDLVAPGEKITAPLMHGQWGELDGTSMAAPHVSGAAAMLMARYSEFIGRPRRIKQILCETATDLGRERSFQGRGMLDVLRAFQSI